MKYIFLLLALCLLPVVWGSTLAEYPDFFTNQSSSIKLVVGDVAIASDTIGAIEIATSLQVHPESKDVLATIEPVLASEVDDVTAENLIVVGGPCANSVAARLLNFPLPCYEGIPSNAALVQLFTFEDTRALLVAGDSALDTRRAARLVANYPAQNLPATTSVKITQTAQREIVVS